MSFSATASFSSSNLNNFEPLVIQLRSRRLLLHSLFSKPPSPPASPPTKDSSVAPPPIAGGFDSNVVMIMAILLCVLMCAVGFNALIRCVLRCSYIHNIPRCAATGIRKKAVKAFPTASYSPGMDMPGLSSECVICLSEFGQGERIRVLPKCHHGFHVKCIDKWLEAHSSCPTCRHCLLESSKKVAGCNTTSGSASTSLQLQVILPLEPEGLIIPNSRPSC